MSRLATVNVVKAFTFDAAHFLPNYDGKCGKLHGHTYTLITCFVGQVGGDRCMVADFGAIKDLVQEVVLDDLDHSCLNDVNWEIYPDPGEDFTSEVWELSQPTAENMVVAIAERLKAALTLPGHAEAFEGVHLRQVTLFETPTSYASWIAEDQVELALRLAEGATTFFIDDPEEDN